MICTRSLFLFPDSVHFTEEIDIKKYIFCAKFDEKTFNFCDCFPSEVKIVSLEKAKYLLSVVELFISCSTKKKTPKNPVPVT